MHPSTRRNRTWDETAMRKAICAYESGAGGLRKVAKTYGVPAATLKGRVNKSVSAREYQARSQMLPPHFEALLCDWIERETDYGRPPSRQAILDEAKSLRSQLGHSDGPKPAWIAAFKKRNTDLAARQDLEKAKVTQLQAWFACLSEFKNVPEENLFSVGAIRIADENRSWTYFLECVSATGRILSPFALFNGGLVDTDLGDWKSHIDDRPSREEPSFDQVALMWLKQTFIPETQELKDRVLALDFEYVSDEFTEICTENKIEVLVMPPHTTHVTQPFAVVISDVLKAHFQKKIQQDDDMYVSDTDRREQLLYVYAEAREIITPELVQTAFKKTGIRPVNSNEVFENPLMEPVLDRFEAKKARAEATGEPLDESDSEDEVAEPLSPDALGMKTYSDFVQFQVKCSEKRLSPEELEEAVQITKELERRVEEIEELGKMLTRMEESGERNPELLAEVDKAIELLDV